MAEYLSSSKKKVTAPLFFEMKKCGEKISWLTAYDYTTASLLDQAGIDTILVGDSASNVMHGNATTLPITVDEMIFHARAVARAAEHAFVVCDMPFGSYQISEEDGIRNAVRIMKEAGVDGVKLEGGAEIAPMVSKIVAAGIPVCGHLGLTPQSVTSSVAMVCAQRKKQKPRNSSLTQRHLRQQDASALYSKRYLQTLPRK